MAYTLPEKRQEAADANRALVLQTARGLFQAKGFDAVSIREIARAAQRSVGSVFTYWTGKEQLFREAMGRPYFTDQRGAEAFAVLVEIAPEKAHELRKAWEAAPAAVGA